MKSKGSNAKIIDQFLALMIQTDERGIIYYNMIDKHIKELFLKGIDLKKYF